MPIEGIGQSVGRREAMRYMGTASVLASLGGCLSGEEGQSDETPTDDSTATQGPTDESTPRSEDVELTLTQGVMPTTLDPHDHSEVPTANVVEQSYERPIKFDREQRVVAELVTEWERVAEDRVQFSIRSDVPFHSGDEMTANDVAYSINRIVDDDVGITSRQQRDVGVTSAEAVDESTVEISTDGPNPIVFSQIAATVTIVQQAWMEDRSDSEIAQSMNGTGPYQLESFEEDVNVVFSSFEDYWGSSPDVTSLTINAASELSTRVNSLLADETDIVVDVGPEQVSRIQESENRVEPVPSSRVIFGVMRDDVAPFESRAFRRAMNYAVNQEEIIEEVLNGFGSPLSQPVFEGVVGYDPDLEPYPYDPEQAAQLVEESGHAGAELTIQTPVGRYLKDVEIAQAMAGHINELPNVSCDVQQRDFGALIGEIVDGDRDTLPEFYLIGWGNEVFDSVNTFMPHLVSTQAPNAYQDETVDDLIQQAQAETDEDEREQLLQQANKRARDEAAWVFLHRQFSIYGVSSRVEWQPRNDEMIFVKEMTVNS